MSAKPDCAHDKRERLRRFCAGLIIILFILLVVVLLVWAILQPQKPRFILQEATIYAFDVSNPNLFTSNIRVTIISRNPNEQIGIYYDNLETYATYRGQQISLPTLIGPTYQDHGEVITWSPFICGTAVPVAPFNAIALSLDQEYGYINLMIKMGGRVRWKVGTLMSGRYHLHVNCRARIPFGDRSTGVFVGKAVKYQMSSICSVGV